MSDKDYSGCEFYISKWQDKFTITSNACRLGVYQEGWTSSTDERITKCCKDNPNCYYKQLEALKAELVRKDEALEKAKAILFKTKTSTDKFDNSFLLTQMVYIEQALSDTKKPTQEPSNLV